MELKRLTRFTSLAGASGDVGLDCAVEGEDFGGKVVDGVEGVSS